MDLEGRPQELVQKPYLVDYIRCMVENHGEDWKVSGSGRQEETLGPVGKAPGPFEF